WLVRRVPLSRRSPAARRRAHRVHDLLIAGAAAQIAGQRLAHFVLARHAAPGTRQELVCGNQHAGRADAALRTACFHEQTLQRRQASVLREPLDRENPGAVRLRRGHEAGIGGPSVDEHGAGAALPFPASFLGAGELALVAQHVEQALHGRNLHPMRLAVDREPEGDLAHAALAARSARKIFSGRTGILSMRMPMAWAIADTTAGAGTSMGSSPTPLAPNGPRE